jgi:transposase
VSTRAVPPPQTCRSCGAVRDPDDGGSLAWVSERDAERTTWLCPGCARTHIRDIEAKLQPDWW